MNYHILYNAVACEVGVNPALILGHFYYWTARNEREGKNIHNGRAWAFNSLSELCKLFPFMSRRAIVNHLNKLKSENYLRTGCYNKVSYDKTNWYSLTDKAKALFADSASDEENALGGSAGFALGQCKSCTIDSAEFAPTIPSNTNNLPRNILSSKLDSLLQKPREGEKDDGEKDFIREVVEYLNAKTGKTYRASTKGTQSAIKARRADGYTLDDFKAVIANRVSKWANDSKMSEYLAPSTLFRPSNFEKYLQDAQEHQRAAVVPSKPLERVTDEELARMAERGNEENERAYKEF